jgi:hypothetical protein
MFLQQNKKGGKTMKKIAVIAIAVLFLLVGFRYASAQQYPNMAGPLNRLSLKITYQEEMPATKTLTKGRKLVTVPSGINNVEDNPILYFRLDPIDGYLTKILVSWLDPNPNSPSYGTKIWTMSCKGGNENAPIPNLPAIQDGGVSTKKQLSLAKPPATETRSVIGGAICWVCPDGFAFDNLGNPTGLCNGGGSYVAGSMFFQGSLHTDLTTQMPTSFSVKGTIDGGTFDYIGEQWASKDCITYPDFPSCKALFTGTFGATLTPCPAGDADCTNM